MKCEERVDYFKINPRDTLKDEFSILKDILLKYTEKDNILIYGGGNHLYFKVTKIKNFKDYFKDICTYAYYNDWLIR